jgi:diphthine-ammonia ligase
MKFLRDLIDELDSYMYQTVGHDAVHLIAEAMELPLYRVTITGQANNQTSSYGNRLASTSSNTLDSTDETEDLFRLLQIVKAAHPEVNAVSVGAILSNYQRVRVEHVALRAELKMLPLSYLWQRDQRELLDEMCQAGMNSILIKVAGAGLGEEDLGKSLVQMRPKLQKLNRMYGAHICGEGGEYESFTLDCPLFIKKIVLDKTTTVTHSDSSFASVYYMQINAAHLEDKEQGSLQDVAVPPILDQLGQATLLRCEAAAADISVHEGESNPPIVLFTTSCITARRGYWCAFGGIIGRASSSVEEEVKTVFDDLMGEQSYASFNGLNSRLISACF